MSWTLAYLDRYLRVRESYITSDTSDSIAFASLKHNIPTRLVAEWTSEQFTSLLSALLIGADLMFPEEADEIIWQLIKVVHQPIPIDEEDDGGCINYPTTSPFVFFQPQDPYNEPDEVPAGYLTPPFIWNKDFDYPELFGYEARDVMVPISSLTAPDSLEDLLSLPFPTIKLSVRGEGQIEWDFLSVQGGGFVVIKVGSPVNIADIFDGITETGVVIIDLLQDVTGFPFESDVVVEHETPINSEELVDVYATFIPKLDVAIDFFGFGGGIRQIGLCGLEAASEGSGMFVESVRYNFGIQRLQYRLAGEWLDVDDWNVVQEDIVNAQSDADEALADAATALSRAIDAEDLAIIAFDLADSAQAAADAAATDAAAAQAAADSAITVNEEQATTLIDHETRITALEADIAAISSEFAAMAVWSKEFDFTVEEDENWSGADGWTSGQGWLFTFGNDYMANTNSINVYDAKITHVEMHTKKHAGSTFSTSIFEWPTGENIQEIRQPSTVGSTAVNWCQINPHDGSDTLQFKMSMASGQEVYLQKMVVWGRGVSPFA